MDNKIISNWIRQARYRAKTHELSSDLEMDDVHTIITHFDDKCVYCSKKAETLDHPFPLRTSAPNIPANILPICRECKGAKKNHDIVWMYTQGYLEQQNYLCILQFMLEQRGKEAIKDYVRRATGIVD